MWIGNRPNRLQRLIMRYLAAMIWTEATATVKKGKP